MTRRPWHVFVLIPARNEELLLPRCLESVRRAGASLPEHVSFEIIVAVDSSTDTTSHLAQTILAKGGRVVHTNAGAVGAARAAAADTALARCDGPLSLCWLAHTDADCVLPGNWLTAQLSLAEQDIEAIAGTVRVDSFAEHARGVAERFRDTYLIHPDGTHPHIHGANFGIRADLYRQLGGWAPIATAEDHDLWSRIVQADRPRVSTSSIQVITSGRKVGRAPHGFAEALAAHNEAVA